MGFDNNFIDYIESKHVCKTNGGGNNQNRKLVMIIECAQKLENKKKHKMGFDNKFMAYIESEHVCKTFWRWQ